MLNMQLPDGGHKNQPKHVVNVKNIQYSYSLSEYVNKFDLRHNGMITTKLICVVGFVLAACGIPFTFLLAIMWQYC
jgi:hypothetical protein